MSNDIYELKEAEQTDYSQNGVEKQNWGKDMGGLPVGIIFVLIGVGLLVANFTPFSFHNWWALFLLIPVFANFGKVLDRYRKYGRLDEAALGALGGGLFMTFIASIFLFGLSWSLLWPVVLILLGVGALTKGMLRR